MRPSEIGRYFTGKRDWLSVLAIVPFCIGSLTLLEWLIGSEILTTILPGGDRMNPMTAVGLVVVGLAIMVHTQARWRHACPLYCVLVAIGVSKLLEATLGLPAIDNLFFLDGSMSQDAFGPGRIAPNTAICFVLLGAAGLLLGLSPRNWVASQMMSASVAFIALFALTGYLLGAAPLYAMSPLGPMAVHSAVGIFVSAICLAGIQRRGLVTIFWDRGPAGSMARSVLPIAVLTPVAIGAARLWGQQAGLYSLEVGVSLQIVANVILTCALVALAIFKVHRADKTRRERETALTRSQAFAHLGHVHWKDPDPRPIWSGEAFRIFGVSVGSTGLSLAGWTELVHSDDRDGFREYLATVRATGLDAEWCGRIVRVDDNAVRQIRVHLATDDAGDSNHASLFGIVSDVTEIERARRHAEHAARAKGAFLANMSHEIRTPLNGVLGFSELLVNADLEEENHEHAKLVHQSAKALLHLLNDILDFSKIEAGSMDITPEPTCLPELFQDCISLIEPAARAKDVAVLLHLRQDIPAWAMVDGLKLRQIALNILGNAVKFTERGFIAMEASCHEVDGKSRLIVRIQDTGVGIAANRQEAIFAEFVQADPTVGRCFGGTGLGLSISRRLAELLGGALTLRSELGRGTTVELDLPMVPAQMIDVREQALVQACEPRSARILLVEDDPLNQKLAITVLTRLGHQVELAADGLDAVDKMQRFERRESEFDLILMDIQLPKLDGMAATTQIRLLGPRSKIVPIIGLSANAYANDVAACLENGMDDHLAKPFSTAGLAHVIARWAQPASQQVAGNVAPEIASDLQPMFLDLCSVTRLLVLELKQALEAGSGNHLAKLVSEVKQASHKLAGTAASFGRTELGSVAKEAEDSLADLTDTSMCTQASSSVDALLAELTATLLEKPAKAA